MIDKAVLDHMENEAFPNRGLDLKGFRALV